MNESVRAAGFSPRGTPRDLKVAAQKGNAPAFPPGTRLDAQLVNSILDRHTQGDATGLIHALQDLQAEFGFVPCEAVEALCERLKVPISKAFSAATFYKAFRLQPTGQVVIRVCTGTACHIRGARTLVNELCSALAIKPGQTTDDRRFTIDTVNCVGACAMAPVVAFNGEYHGNVQPGTLTRRVKKK